MEEMNEFETKPRGTFWRDWGVYGALALCLAIIGAAVALTSLPEKEEAQEAPPENLTAAAPRQQEALPELELDFPRQTSLPVIRILPTATAEPVPSQVAEATAAPAKSTSAKAQAPVSGQVIWGYAADKLIYSKTPPTRPWTSAAPRARR